jgi:hypothetical protein
MSEVRLLSEQERRQIPAHQCWSLWREDLPCPNRATWHITNLDNEGESYMCDVHHEDFARNWPTARVRFRPIKEATP